MDRPRPLTPRAQEAPMAGIQEWVSVSWTVLA